MSKPILLCTGMTDSRLEKLRQLVAEALDLADALDLTDVGIDLDRAQHHLAAREDDLSQSGLPRS